MSTPDNHGKKAPQFAAFKPLTTVQNANDCCCDGACSSSPTLSENVSGTRYSWKVSGMDCAACARKVENAVRQLAGVNQVQVLFATEKLVVDADNDIRAQVESAVQKAGYSLRDEQAADEPQASRLKENLPLITLIVMMAISWGLEQFNHPFGQLAFIATTLVGLYPIARQALRLIKSGSYFAIETLMSVAAIGALFIGATAEAAMVLLLFLIGERLEGWAASRARQGVSALMALKPETATRLRNGEREEVAITSGLAAAARRGALIKGGAALEQLGRVTQVAFDKTGTLTVGKPRVTAIHPATGISESELLTLAAAVEQGATHPLAQAIVREVQVAELAIPTAESQRALVGSGIEAQVNGERVLICAAGKHPADAFAGLINELESAGQTVVLVVRNDDVLGIIALQDTLRADAATAISELNALGVKGVILTGDNPRAAAAIAGELGLEFKAGLLPEDKVKAVTKLNQHAPLAMVGDGINDAPAMKAAAIGIAMGSGTDVALETADAALTHNHLRGLVQMIELARATHANIRQNITIALGLKGIFLVTTLLGMTGLWLAVLADTGATVLVTANALRLLRRR